MIDEDSKAIHSTSIQKISASWYKALTLTERIVLWRKDGKKKLAPECLDMDLAARKLLWWKELFPLGKGTQFTERLAIDELTEEDLFYLLAEPIEATQERVPGDMAWLDKLTQAFILDDIDLPCPLPDLPDVQGVELLLRAIRPLLHYAWKRLHVEMQHVMHRQKSPPFEPETVMSLIFMQLPGQLLAKVSKVLTLELHIMRIEGRLQGETAEERFAYFIDWCSQPLVMLSVLEKYPVLARQLMAQMDQWRETSLEFLQRLCGDWKEIRALFAPGTDPLLLVEIRGGAGDVHRGGRSVFLLRFSSGLRLVYKPRSLSIDIHFQELLAWLNVRSKLPAFRTMRILDKGTYGWSEFIDACDCTAADQIERFYIRQGAYLALLHTLSATDVHAENLVAEGEHPVLIDLEALFRPRIQQEKISASTESARLPQHIAEDILQSSVLAVGLLPCRFWSNQQMAGIDISGMGDIQGKVFPLPVAKWTNVGTDQMRVVRDYTTLLGRQNCPRLNGQAVDLANYQHCIVFGFVSMYQLLVDYREEILATVLPRFGRDEIRLILRPTMVYSLILQESFHPDVLRDSLDVYRYLDRLWDITIPYPHMASVVAAERADLLVGDIPFFLTHVASQDLYTSRAERLPAFCSLSGLDTVVQRLQSLDEQDLVRQVWIIQASMAALAETREHSPVNALKMSPATGWATPERLLEAAASIGHRLDLLSVRDEQSVHWLGLSLVQMQSSPDTASKAQLQLAAKPGTSRISPAARNQEWKICVLGNDFYNGLSGIAFFLAYLGEGKGHERAHELAYTIALSLSKQVMQSPPSNFSGTTIGAFDGWGSLLYVFSHLSALWQESWLIEASERVLSYISPLIEQDKQLDVVHGAAGCLLAILSLYTVLPAPHVLAEAIKCGDHLVETLHLLSPDVSSTSLRQAGLLTGYAHGAAGIASSLIQLAAVCQQKHFYKAALPLLAFERQLFSVSKKNWPDLREGLATTDSRFMVAWCHGAAGLGLSRMELLKYADEDFVLRQEVNFALETTLKEGFGYNHALCHGDLGNLELLLTATQQLGMTQYLEPLARLTAMLLECGERYGWVTGLPLGVETPGMMLGLAGIGYQLLRLAQPQAIPNILLLAPPTYMNVGNCIGE